MQETLPARAQGLSQTQRAFLHILAELLPQIKWEGDALQVCIFNAARRTPIDQPSAFKAIYRVLLDRENGPKAGNFLSFLERDFVVGRCKELPVDRVEFLKQSSMEPPAFQQWLAQEKANVKNISAKIDQEHDKEAIEFLVTLGDEKTYCKRVLLEGEGKAKPWLDDLRRELGVDF